MTLRRCLTSAPLGFGSSFSLFWSSGKFLFFGFVLILSHKTTAWTKVFFFPSSLGSCSSLHCWLKFISLLQPCGAVPNIPVIGRWWRGKKDGRNSALTSSVGPPRGLRSLLYSFTTTACKKGKKKKRKPGSVVQTLPSGDEWKCRGLTYVNASIRSLRLRTPPRRRSVPARLKNDALRGLVLANYPDASWREKMQKFTLLLSFFSKTTRWRRHGSLKWQ